MRIGDYITLKSIVAKNYLCAEGILSDDVFVGTMNSFDDNFFEICPPRQYTAINELTEHEAELEEQQATMKEEPTIAEILHNKRHLDALEKGYLNEQKLNELDMKQKMGSPIHYGESIQLRHVKSKKYVTVFGTEVAKQEKENIRVVLHPDGMNESHMVIEPRFKVNQAGDPIYSNAEIKLVIAERSNEFLHCATKGYFTQFAEVNASLESTAWCVTIFQSAVDVLPPNNQNLLTSELIHLYDPETQSNVSIFQRPPAISNSDDMSDVSDDDDDSIMALSEEGQVIIEANETPVSTSALWVMESRDIVVGGPVAWKTDLVRFKHINSGKYMCMTKEGRDSTEDAYLLGVTDDQNDKGTLFNVYELHSSGQYLEDNRAIQLCHGHTFLEKRDYQEIAEFRHFSCGGTRNKARAVFLFIKRYNAADASAEIEEECSEVETKQPLDIFVGATLRNFFKKYHSAIPDFSAYHDSPDLRSLTIQEEELEDDISLPSIRSAKSQDDNKLDEADRIWPGLDNDDDKTFFEVVAKVINYIKGDSISNSMTEECEDEIDDDTDPVNEFGDIVRNDALIELRQSMICEQGTLSTILFMLHAIVPLFQGGSITDDISLAQADSQKAPPIKRAGSFTAVATDTADAKKLKLLLMAGNVSKVLLRILKLLLKRHPRNQLYVAHHIKSVLEWVDVMPIAAEVMKEMLSENELLQHKHVTIREVEMFTSHLVSPQTKMKRINLEMLRMFCSCAGEGVSRNQSFVMTSLMPHFDQIFITMKKNTIFSQEFGPEYFIDSIYLPINANDSQIAPTIVGLHMLQEGCPAVALTWTCPNSSYNPMVLMNSDLVPIIALFEKQRAELENKFRNARPALQRQGSRRRTNTSKSGSKSKRISVGPEVLRNAQTDQICEVAGYLITQLHLAADMCLGRNYQAIAKLEALFPYDLLVSILACKSFMNNPLNNISVTAASAPNIQGSAAKLMGSLYVDRESETTSLMPFLSRTWSSLQESSMGVLPCVAPERTYRFGILQHVISQHIRSMRTDGTRWDSQSQDFVLLVDRLLKLLFYGTTEKLLDVINPIMTCLNRANPDLDGGSSILRSISRSESSVAKKSLSLTGLKVTDEEENSNVPWQEPCLVFMESVTELAIVMSLVMLSTGLAIFQVVTAVENIYLTVINIVISFFFFAEVSLRGYVHHYVRQNWIKFFKDPFVQLDIGIVFLDVIVMAFASFLGSLGSFSKTLRVLRMLRLARVARAARLLKQINKKEETPTKWVLPARYRTCPPYELQTMDKMVNVLYTVQGIIHDRNLSLLLRGFRDWIDRTNGDDKNGDVAVECFEKVVEESKVLRISNFQKDDTLMDLVMYVNPILVQSVLDLLFEHHSTLQTLLSNVRNVQLLTSNKREKQFKLVHKMVLQLDRNIETFSLWKESKQQSQVRIGDDCVKILQVLRDNCRTRRQILKFDEDYEADPVMQDLLRNFGFTEVAFKLLKKLLLSLEEDDVMSSSHDITVRILRACNNLLYYYTINNTSNQEDLFEEFDVFRGSLDLKINSHTVIPAIFVNNEKLMRKVPNHYIMECTDNIMKVGRFSQYLSLLKSITAVGEKNILENQYEIVKQLSSPIRLKKILCFFCPVDTPEYARKVKLMQPYLHAKDVDIDGLAAELCYHLELLRVLSGCTVGFYNITTIETKVQAMFFYEDIIDAILDPHSVLVVKIHTGIFFFNGYLEVEMQLPGLTFSPKMWKLLQHCSDVLAAAKDELRHVERNGWDASTSSRQKIEYIVCCAMMVYGFFKLYYDAHSFTREHAATYGTNSNPLTLKQKEIDALITRLFEVMLGIYQQDTPLLSLRHKQYVYDGLDALSKAKGVVLSDFCKPYNADDVSIIEKSMAALQETDKPEKLLMEQCKTFLDCITNSERCQELLEEEFQQIIKKIQSLPLSKDGGNATVRYEPFIKKLVDHVRGGIKIVSNLSGSYKTMNPRCTKTSIWIIKLFRTMIENAWGMSIYERDDDGGEEQDEASAHLVATFNQCGATTLILDLMADGIEQELVLEAVKFGVALLFKEGGALEVQQTMHAHLVGKNSEFFFLQLRHIISMLKGWHDWNGVVVLEDDEEPELPDSIITIRFMQLMCEGHYCPNQDIMREQPDVKVSVNLLDDLVQYMVVLGRYPCRTSTHAALAVGATVLEVIQGPCEGNQDHFALNTQLTETLNHQMRSRLVEDQDEGEELELKKTCIDIFQGLLEGQGAKTAVYERVLSVIHLDVIQLLCSSDKSADEPSDPELEEIEIVLQTESLVLLRMLCDFKPSLRNELEVVREADEKGGGGNVASVEIMWRGELQRRFFNIPDICKEFTDTGKANFVEYVDRSTQENKLLDMYERTSVIYTEVLHAKFLNEKHISGIFSRQNQNRATWVTFILACVINIILIMYYEGTECFEGYGPADDDFKPTDDYAFTDVECAAPVLGSGARTAVNALNMCQIIFASFTLLLFLVVRAPVQYQNHMADDKGMIMSIIWTALDPMTLYYLVYVLMACISIQVDHILPFFLLDVVIKNSYAMDVMIAVFYPIKQLVIAVILFLFVMYIFGISMFLEPSLNEGLMYSEDCATLWSCYKFVAGYGISADMNDYLQRLNDQWYFMTAFDLCTRFVLHNVVMGIIVDTFSELREEKIERLRDTTETCFICGFDKQVFDRDKESEGFNVHVKKEHCMWNYIYFMIYIWQQDKDDDDGLEQYVRRCIEANDISWFPTNRAMCLSTSQGDDNENEESREEFQRDIELMEVKFSNELQSYQADVIAATHKIKGMLRESTLYGGDALESGVQNQAFGAMDSVSVGSESVSLAGKDNRTNQKITVLTKSMLEDRLHSLRGTTITIEILEIVGLTFDERVLDNLSCRVLSKLGNVQVDCSHVLYPEDQSMVIFDPIEIIVCENYTEKDNDKVVMIQIARGAQGDDIPRFLAHCQMTIGEIYAATETHILQQSFSGRVGGDTSMGVIRLNTSAKSFGN